MKEAIKNNKKIIIIGVFIIVLLLIGITYAYLRTTLQGEEEYVIRAGTLDLVLGEGNELTLEKQKPIEDEEGMSLDGFTFSLTNNGIAMIEDNITWYLGKIDNGSSYKLAKYTDTNMTGYTSTINSKVGLLRYGELMAGQFNRNVEKGETYNRTNLTIYYWTLTPYTSSYVWTIGRQSSPTAFSSSNSLNGIKPALNLKSNVIITGGGGTKENPFTLQLAS